MRYIFCFLVFFVVVSLSSCKSIYFTRSGKTLQVTVDSTVTLHGSEFSR